MTYYFIYLLIFWICHISYIFCNFLLKLGYFNSRNQFSSIFKNYCWLLKNMFIGWLKVILQRLFPFLINFVVKISWNIKVAFSRKTPLSYISTPLFDVSFGLFRFWNRWYIRVRLFHFIQWRDQFFKHFLMYILFPIWFVFIYSLNYFDSWELEKWK